MFWAQKLKKIYFVSLLTPSLFFLNSCSEHKQANTVNFAANRKMGAAPRFIRSDSYADRDPGLQQFFSTLVQKGLRQTYNAQTVGITLAKPEPLEDPDNLYQIGVNQTDDLFVFDVNLKGHFDIPSASKPIPDKAHDKSGTANALENAAEFSFTIYNGANLRAVSAFNFVVPVNQPEYFEAEFIKRFQKEALGVFANANIYPKSNPEHFGDLLYVYSQQREKDLNDEITCENARDVLKYYAKAEELYKLASNRGVSKVFGQQSEIHQLETRLADSTEKHKTMDLCEQDRNLTFKVDYDFGQISSTNQAYLMRAFQNVGFEDLLRKYTDKPALVRMQIEQNGDLDMFVEIRFDLQRYRLWIKDRVPMKYRNFQILSLSPYYALMQKIVMVKSSLPVGAPPQLQQSMRNLRATLGLKTLLKGEVYFGVDGSLSSDRKSIRMAYPNSIHLNSPGFDARNISNKNNEIFQDKGWIALGNCKTLDGTYTEDGLVYKFFGFPCQ